MSEEPPRDPVFDNAPGNTGDSGEIDSKTRETEKEQLERIREAMPKFLNEQKDRRRSDQFYPFLLVRSYPGDRGNRPFNNIPFWESPDIWVAAGEPSATPAIPANPGGQVMAGQPNTVYAHVWNLGRAPIVGVRVEFYWFNPSLGIDGAHANLIGHARVDLGPRSSATCHKLVKCASAWRPVFENAGHECLVVRASSVGDNISVGHPWDPWADRHVGQRNMAVVQPGTNVSHLMELLDMSRLRQARVELVQMGIEGKIAVDLVAPQLSIHPLAKTHILAELLPNGRIELPPTNPSLQGARLPLHPTLSADQFEMRRPEIPSAMPLEVARISIPKLLRFATTTLEGTAAVPQQTMEKNGHIRVLEQGGNIALLLQHASLLSPKWLGRVTNLPEPTRQQAQVLRLATYDGEQLIGGYTFVLCETG